jgi:Mrp family chromosome partitioning ATPase
MAATFLLGMALVVTSGLLLGAHRSRERWGRRREDAAPALETGEQPTLAVAPSPSAAPKTEIAPRPSERFVKMSSIKRIASYFAAKAPGTGGYRTLVTGESDSVEPGEEAAELAKALAHTGDAVIIVAWSPESDGIAQTPGVAAKSGMNELLDGAATFEDAVYALPGSRAHCIAAGEMPAEPTAALDPDRINLVLDALDEAYDHIVVVARHEDARTLFELIQGRFDAGVIVSDAQRRVLVIHDQPDTFLGFEVDGIELVRFERPAIGAIAGERGLRAGNKSHLEAHPN